MKQSEIQRLILPAAGVFALATGATAQTDLYVINGAAVEDKAGESLASAGLFSADTNPDTIVGAPENFIIFSAGEGKATAPPTPEPEAAPEYGASPTQKTFSSRIKQV